MVNATTLTRLKAYMDATDTVAARDALWTSLIGAVSREFESYIGYPLLQTSRTEYHDVAVGDEIIFLDVLPVVSVTTVKIGASGWDFAAQTALTADSDYRVGDLAQGQIYINFEVRGTGYHKAQIVYVAGLGATDEAVAAAAENMALACNMQVAEDWNRRQNPMTVSIPGPSGAKTMASPSRLMPRVLELLAPYRRIVL